MLLEFTCIVAGFIAGMTYRQERLFQQYQKTREEVKREVSQEFDYYRNLCESLKQDLHHLKTKGK
jgi:hypothetical protein